MTRVLLHQRLLIVGPVLGSMMLAVLGCAPSRYHVNAGSGAPGLSQSDRGRGHGGTNPNAPFTLITRSHSKPAGAAPGEDSMANEARLRFTPECSPQQLEAVEVAQQVNGDQRFVSLAFVNDGTAACKLSGYPSLFLLDETGATVATVAVVQSVDGTSLSIPEAAAAKAAGSSSSGEVELLLAAHGEAYFGISWLSGEDCPQVSRLMIGPPGMTRTFSVNHPLTVCSGQVRVTALHSSRVDAPPSS